MKRSARIAVSAFSAGYTQGHADARRPQPPAKSEDRLASRSLELETLAWYRVGPELAEILALEPLR